MDGDVGQSALVGRFSPVCRLQPSVPRDVLVLVFRGGRSKGEGLHPVQRVACSLDPLDRMYMPRSPGTVPRYMLPVMVEAGSGWRRGARSGAGLVVVLKMGVAEAVWGDVYGEGSDGALYFMGLDVVEVRHRPCMGVPLADPHGVRP